MIGDKLQVIVDRPMGCKHPKHELYYPINYGYVEGVLGGDGEEQDVYVLGVDHPVDRFCGVVIAIVKRLDDVEEKWVVAPEGMSFEKEEIEKQVFFQEQYFKHVLLMKEQTMPYQAVIFDMDGLMIDSERVTYEGYCIECEKLGYTMNKAFYRQILGLPKPSIFRKFHKAFGEDFPIEEIMQRVHAYMEEEFSTKGVPIKEGLIELLSYLKERHIPTMIATSSNRVRVDRILSQSGLTPYVQDVICGDEVERGKPNPDIFLNACAKLHVETSCALVLEDSEAGIQASYDAGVDVICVPDMKDPSEEYRKKTKAVKSSLLEVLAYISAR